MSELVGELKTDLKSSDKQYRHAYANERLNALVATQIKVLREQRGWRQEDLAENAVMHQPMISRYENVNYSSWSIKTLKQLAFAFDVILEVKFRSFGDMVRGVDEFSRGSLEVPKFADDPFFKVIPVLAERIDESEPRKERTGNVLSFDARKALASKGQRDDESQWGVPNREHSEGGLANAACGGHAC